MTPPPSPWLARKKTGGGAFFFCEVRKCGDFMHFTVVRNKFPAMFVNVGALKWESAREPCVQFIHCSFFALQAPLVYQHHSSARRHNNLEQIRGRESGTPRCDLWIWSKNSTTSPHNQVHSLHAGDCKKRHPVEYSLFWNREIDDGSFSHRNGATASRFEKEVLLQMALGALLLLERIEKR